MSWLTRLFQATLQPSEADFWRSEHDEILNDCIDLRAALISIRNQGMTSKSGTARAMANKAKEALR